MHSAPGCPYFRSYTVIYFQPDLLPINNLCTGEEIARVMADIITAIAPVNIALIKYWGKRDEELILPLNDSFSATLDTSIMHAKTSVCARPDFTTDEIWLNGRKESFESKRLKNCLLSIKRKAAAEKSVSDDFLSWKVRVCSVNNFPTAAGLASSAAGYACLVIALAKLYKVKSDVSAIARLGSGSACRSVYGGFVQWCAGVDPQGVDSFATQIVEKSHWPEMCVLILVVEDHKKKTSSTEGMKITVQTSELLKHRVQHIVPKRIDEIIDAIYEKNFPKFAEITMKDSNQFHAVCLDSYPPIAYLTDVSHSIIQLIHSYNKACGEEKVAYTFDAGRNACLFLLQSEVPVVISLIKHIFPSSNPEFVTGITLFPEVPLSPEILQAIDIQPQATDLIKYVINTRIGDGPSILSDGLHLLNEQGEPINVQ